MKEKQKQKRRKNNRKTVLIKQNYKKKTKLYIWKNHPFKMNLTVVFFFSH